MRHVENQRINIHQHRQRTRQHINTVISVAAVINQHVKAPKVIVSTLSSTQQQIHPTTSTPIPPRQHINKSRQSTHQHRLASARRAHALPPGRPSEWGNVLTSQFWNNYFAHWSWNEVDWQQLRNREINQGEKNPHPLLIFSLASRTTVCVVNRS